tara:strand:- start:55 stop:486 length:432 start_codon:yes stop_codon:yes gene_type:complete
MTKEQTKEYHRLYRIKSRAKVLASKKRWRDANKEKTAAYSKEYNKTWRAENKDKTAVSSRAAKARNTLLYNVVYCIPNYDGKGGNYAGITNNVYERMFNHKVLGKQNIDDWFILDIKTDRTEALASERFYHSQGYDGATHKNR